MRNAFLFISLGFIATWSTLSAQDKPAVVSRTQEAQPASIDAVIKALKRFAVKNKTPDNTLPATILEVPKLVTKGTSPAVTDRPIFELKDTDGKVITNSAYGFRLEGVARLSNEQKENIHVAVDSVSRGIPHSSLFLDENGTLYYEGKKLTIRFAYFDEGEDQGRLYPEVKQDPFFKQFADHLLKVTLTAASEDLTTVDYDFDGETDARKKFYFGVKYANGANFPENVENPLQQMIARVLAGEDNSQLKVEEKTGVISYGQFPIKIRFYYLGSEPDPVVALPAVTQQELQNRLRKQAKQVLIVSRRAEEKRKTLIAEAGKQLTEAEAVFSRTTTDKKKRVSELSTALGTIDKAEELLTKNSKGESEVQRQLSRILTLRGSINTAIDAATFPIVLELASTCGQFQLRQESRTTFTLSNNADKKNEVIAVFPSMPSFTVCDGDKAVVYGRWKTPTEADKIAVKTVYDLQKPTHFTQETLASTDGRVLLYFQGSSMKLALGTQGEDSIASARFQNVTPALAGVRLEIEGNPYSRFEFPLDGSFYRTRLNVESNGEFTFILNNDNTVQIFQNIDNQEVLKATVRGFDTKTATVGSKSLVFKASSVLAADGITLEAFKAGLDQASSSGTVYLLNGSKIIPVAQDTGEKIYGTIAFNAASKKFQLKVDGDEGGFQEIALDGPLLRRRLKLAAQCEQTYRIIESEEGVTTLYRLNAEAEDAIADITGVGAVACAGNGIALVVKTAKGAAITGAPTLKPSLSPDALAVAKTSNLVILGESTGSVPSFVGAFPIPTGVDLIGLKTDETGNYAFTLKWGEEIPVQLSPAGAWSQATWYGNPLESKHALLLSSGKRANALLFRDGVPYANFTEVRSASALGQFVSIVAYGVALAADTKGALKETPFSLTSDQLTAGTAFSFSADGMIHRETAINAPQLGGVTLVELSEREGVVWRRLEFQGNQNYSIYLEMGGEGFDPQPVPKGEKKAFQWKSAPAGQG